MALPIIIGGTQTFVPGIYSSLTVASSIPQANISRSVFILGEAEEGVPGQLLDIKANFYQDLETVKDFYKAGPIVDAVRQLLSRQPSNVFSGGVDRIYVYKTNQSTRAEKAISAPTNFGKIVSSRYGERGNQVRTQILQGQAEVKPSKSFAWLPSPAARNLKVSVNGAVSATLALGADALASSVQTALAGVTGLSATGGAARTTVVSGPMTADLSASGDLLTITRASGVATFDSSSIAAGDSCYIDAALPVSGGADENAGAYLVQSVTSTVLVLKRMKSHDGTAEVNASAFDPATGISLAATDLKINAPITVAVSATTLAGQGASLEILEATGSKLVAGLIAREADFGNVLVDAVSSVANISVSVPSAGKALISLSSGSWSSTPKAGDLVRISLGSLIDGATNKNVGMLIVESATNNTIACSHLFSGLTTEAVSAVALNGANDVLQVASGWLSSSVAAKLLTSSAERKVQLDCVRTTDGASQSNALIGGNVILELAYYHASATAATVSIDAQRVMTIDLTGTGLSDIVVNTKKYATLQDLVDFLNTQSGLSARVSDSRLKSLPSSCLDMVSAVGILGGHAVSAYNGRIKKDYYDWKQYFAENTSLVAFSEGGMSLKAGLPDAESAASFLTGGAVGASSNADIQSGLDEALKVSVRHVVPLFSRDAFYDVADGLTDMASSYSIDAINAAVKSHVATASGVLFKKRRFGMVSWDGAFTDAQQKVGDMGYERCQMFFQRHQAIDGNGELKLFLPWMAACAVAAGRSQAITGASMLRKPFNLSSVNHIGQQSLYSDTLLQDFDPEDRGELEEAIKSGLAVLRQVPGFGVRMESPDLTTRSRVSDPQGWFWERMNVIMTADEVLEACEQTLDNFIGNRTSDTPLAVVRSALNDVLKQFTVGSGNGALLKAEVIDVKSLGNGYKASIKFSVAEALEFIIVDALAERATA